MVWVLAVPLGQRPMVISSNALIHRDSCTAMVSSVWLVLICFCVWLWILAWVVCPISTTSAPFCEPQPPLLTTVCVWRRSWILDYQEWDLLFLEIFLLLSKIFLNPSEDVWYFHFEKHSRNAWSLSALCSEECCQISWHLRFDEAALELEPKSLAISHHQDEVSPHCEYFDSCGFW